MDKRFKSDSWSIQARNSAPHPALDKSLSGNVTTLFVMPVLCLKNTFSPSPDNGWEGGSKNRRHPSLLHMDPIYRPTWQRPVGLLAHSWIPAGEGEGCWVASHVRWNPGAATLLLDTDPVFLAPCFLLGPISGACPLSATSPYLTQPPTSILASEDPPLGSWGLCAFLPILRSQEEVMASQQLPPEPCHSCSLGGRGARVKSSCINMVRELLQSHLDSLLITRISAAFSSLSRWLSARRSDRA